MITLLDTLKSQQLDTIDNSLSLCCQKGHMVKQHTALSPVLAGNSCCKRTSEMASQCQKQQQKHGASVFWQRLMYSGVHWTVETLLDHPNKEFTQPRLSPRTKAHLATSSWNMVVMLLARNILTLSSKQVKTRRLLPLALGRNEANAFEGLKNRHSQNGLHIYLGQLS